MQKSGRVSIVTLIGLMLCLLIGGGGQVKAQNAKEISGTVTDSRGEVVISGTVKVKDSMTATMTDINGKYKISAPANGVLVFSYLGYTRKYRYHPFQATHLTLCCKKRAMSLTSSWW